MNNRYNELKNFYKDYIIFIKNKNKYISLSEDREILIYLHHKKLKDFKKYNINYIILDNLDIIEKVKFINNRYDEFYVKMKLYMLLEWGKKNEENSCNCDDVSNRDN